MALNVEKDLTFKDVIVTYLNVKLHILTQVMVKNSTSDPK
jgi:hypothetical protein